MTTLALSLARTKIFDAAEQGDVSLLRTLRPRGGMCALLAHLLLLAALHDWCCGIRRPELLAPHDG